MSDSTDDYGSEWSRIRITCNLHLLISRIPELCQKEDGHLALQTVQDLIDLDRWIARYPRIECTLIMISDSTTSPPRSTKNTTPPFKSQRQLFSRRCKPPRRVHSHYSHLANRVSSGLVVPVDDTAATSTYRSRVLTTANCAEEKTVRLPMYSNSVFPMDTSRRC